MRKQRPRGRVVLVGGETEKFPPPPLPGFQILGPERVQRGLRLRFRPPPSNGIPALDSGTPSAPPQGTFSSSGRQCALCHLTRRPRATPASNSPTLALARLSRGEALGAAPGRAPPPPPSLVQAAAAQTKETLPLRPSPAGPLRWDGHCVSPEALGRGGLRAYRRFKYQGEGRLRGALGGENKGGRDANAEEAAEQMRKPARTQAGGGGGGPHARSRDPRAALGFLPAPEGAAEARPGTPSQPPLCRDPGRGRGPRQSQPSRGRPRARGAPPPSVWPPPAFPARRALCSRPGAGARGGGGPGARGTYVSLWRSARRSLGTLRRWDSRLRSPSTVSSGGTARS
ncbi:hypothetical protein P7K49_032759 [Saguinus oedipus]|uniref:Basic proline-rich protein-like n=1 Tax=Saguinus oedipus TaxID=9490 RepID=A0ABQ9TPZ4_SAGOE|nr:hypothetical protein P7K49_032759 [Saguinus oedipus]